MKPRGGEIGRDMRGAQMTVACGMVAEGGSIGWRKVGRWWEGVRSDVWEGIETPSVAY